MEHSWDATRLRWDHRLLRVQLEQPTDGQERAHLSAEGQPPSGGVLVPDSGVLNGYHSPAASLQASQPSAAAGSGSGLADGGSAGSGSDLAVAVGGAKLARRAAAGGALLGKKAGKRGVRPQAVCQVDGCAVSLESGKAFYRLQRICEEHARALSVTDASGKALRFCQQCTRLHPVSDFEGSKRSCVASLQRRMERKQKQQQKREQEQQEVVVAAAVRVRRTRGSSRGGAVAAAAAADATGICSADAAVGWEHSHSSSGEGRSHRSGSGSGSSNHGRPGGSGGARGGGGGGGPQAWSPAGQGLEHGALSGGPLGQTHLPPPLTLPSLGGLPEQQLLALQQLQQAAYAMSNHQQGELVPARQYHHQLQQQQPFSQQPMLPPQQSIEAPPPPPSAPAQHSMDLPPQHSVEPPPRQQQRQRHPAPQPPARIPSLSLPWAAVPGAGADTRTDLPPDTTTSRRLSDPGAPPAQPGPNKQDSILTALGLWAGHAQRQQQQQQQVEAASATPPTQDHAPHVPLLTPEELDQLLVMEPDALAAALLARTDPSSGGGSGGGSIGGLGGLRSGSGGGGNTSTGTGSGVAQLWQSCGVGQQWFSGSGGGPGPGQWHDGGSFGGGGSGTAGSTGHGLQRDMHSMALSSPPPRSQQQQQQQHPPSQQQQQQALSQQAGSLEPPGLGGRPNSMNPPSAAPAAPPPSTLPRSSALASWPAAQEAAAMLYSAAAPLHQAASAPPFGGAAADIEPLVVRFSLKVYGLRPHELPPTLQQELQQAVSAAPTVLNGAIRSGCTHLTTNLLLTGAEAAALQRRPGGAAAALAHLSRCWEQQWELPARQGRRPVLHVVAQAEADSAALLLQPLLPPPPPLPAAALEEEAGGATAEAAAGREGREEGSSTAGWMCAPGGIVCPINMGDGGSSCCTPSPSPSSAAALESLHLSLSGPAATTVSAAAGRFQLSCLVWPQMVLGGEEQGPAPSSTASGSGSASRPVLHCRSRGRHVCVALTQLPLAPSSAGEGQRRHGAAADTDEEQEEEEQQQQQKEESSDAASEGEEEEELEEGEEEEDGQWRQQGGQAWVPAAESQWGLYEFEVASGPMLGAALPVLVLPDELVAAAVELQQLQAAAVAQAAERQQQVQPGETAAEEWRQQQQGGEAAPQRQPGLPAFVVRVLRLVGIVLEYLEEGREVAAAVAAGAPCARQMAAAQAAAYPPPALQRLAAAARWLCALCVRCRWPALLRQLLPATTAAPGGAAVAAAGMDALLLPAGLLGTAAAGGSSEVLQVLADWAECGGCSRQLAGSTSGSVTPLHLAAALGPRLSLGAATGLVRAVGPSTAAAWWRSVRAGGWTPRQVAAAAGAVALLQLLDGSGSGSSSTATAPLAAALAATEEEEEASEGGGVSAQQLQAVHCPPSLPPLPASLVKGSRTGSCSGGSCSCSGDPGSPTVAPATMNSKKQLEQQKQQQQHEEPEHEASLLLAPHLEPAWSKKAGGGCAPRGLSSDSALPHGSCAAWPALAMAAAGAAGTRGTELGMQRLPATAAEMEAWQKRPLHPAMLLAFGGAAVLIALAMVAAARSGLYDEY